MLLLLTFIVIALSFLSASLYSGQQKATKQLDQTLQKLKESQSKDVQDLNQQIQQLKVQVQAKKESEIKLADAPAPVATPQPAPAPVVAASTIIEAQTYAKGLVPPDQWSCLYNLWMRESGWSATAINPSSGAAGIAQSLGHGYVQLGDYVGQINWGLSYIGSRYGNPCGAWEHELSVGWY